MTHIYTKTGDSGETSLADGRRVSKSDLRCHATGDLDELNTFLGFIRTLDTGQDYQFLETIQSTILHIGSVASGWQDKGGRGGEVPLLENWIDQIDRDLAPLQSFILPGGTPLACYFHISRTICRRAERSLVELCLTLHDRAPEQELIHYINRLSDLLFVCARHANFRMGVADSLWEQSRLKQSLDNTP